MGTITHEELRSMGFKNVFNTTETFAGGKTAMVLWGSTPFTWGHNNGVAVVYDANAEPWLKYGFKGSERHALRIFELKGGAYVPHSNDGGRFVREVLPTL